MAGLFEGHLNDSSYFFVGEATLKQLALNAEVLQVVRQNLLHEL